MWCGPGCRVWAAAPIPTAEDQAPPGCCDPTDAQVGVGVPGIPCVFPVCFRGSLYGRCPGEAARFCCCTGSGRKQQQPLGTAMPGTSQGCHLPLGSQQGCPCQQLQCGTARHRSQPGHPGWALPSTASHSLLPSSQALWPLWPAAPLPWLVTTSLGTAEHRVVELPELPLLLHLRLHLPWMGGSRGLSLAVPSLQAQRGVGQAGRRCRGRDRNRDVTSLLAKQYSTATRKPCRESQE